MNDTLCSVAADYAWYSRIWICTSFANHPAQIVTALCLNYNIHIDTCVGLAANMIGVSKAIIAIRDEKRFLLLYNPVITMHSLTYYDTEEGCLSLAGKRPCRRYDWVEVKYEDENFHKKRKRFQGFTAEIIQHEMDHLEGILI